MIQTNTFVYTKKSSNTRPVFVLTSSTCQTEDNNPMEIVANNYGPSFIYKRITNGTLTLSNANTTIVVENGTATNLNVFPIGEPVNVQSSNGTTVSLLFKPLAGKLFANVSTVDVTTFYQLELNTYAIVVEGSANATTNGEFYVQHNNTSLLIVDGPYAANSQDGYHCIKASPNSITLVGECRLVTFNITNG